MSDASPPQALPTYWRVYGRGNRVTIVRADTQAEYNAAVAKLRWQPMGRERAKVHQCAVCQEFGAWGTAWFWYGSYRDLDDENPIVKVCSKRCADEAKTLKLVPRNASFTDD